VTINEEDTAARIVLNATK